MLSKSSSDLVSRKIITEKAAAEFLSFSTVHLRRLRRLGLGPRYVHLGERRVGYRIADLEAWIQARLVENG